MVEVAVITDEVHTVEATIAGDRILIDPLRLFDAVGWTLKPEGLCQDDHCVPVSDVAGLYTGSGLDLAAVAAALGRPAVIDAEAGLAAMALSSEARREALDGLQAPAFALADLDGRPHNLDEWRGRKKLLVAFSTW